LTDFVSGKPLPSLSTLVRQELLETSNVRKRLENLIRELSKELEVLELPLQDSRAGSGAS